MITHGFFTGTSPISLSVSGLPAGVTFTDNSDGSWTLAGTWPASGTYTYGVTATNTAGSTTVTGNQLISSASANPITFGDYLHLAPCAVADLPANAQFVIEFMPNGEVWLGTNTEPAAAQPQGWHDGTVSSSDYEIRLTDGGYFVTALPSGVWHSLASAKAFQWDLAITGDFNVLATFEIREVATGTIVGTATFCQQIGIGVPCEAC